MIPYKIKFHHAGDNTTVSFESNEKPVKGDVFTIKAEDGKLSMVKIIEVTKILNSKSNNTADLEYNCNVEAHQENTSQIGFGKR